MRRDLYRLNSDDSIDYLGVRGSFNEKDRIRTNVANSKRNNSFIIYIYANEEEYIEDHPWLKIRIKTDFKMESSISRQQSHFFRTKSIIINSLGYKGSKKNREKPKELMEMLPECVNYYTIKGAREGHDKIVGHVIDKVRKLGYKYLRTEERILNL